MDWGGTHHPQDNAPPQDDVDTISVPLEAAPCESSTVYEKFEKSESDPNWTFTELAETMVAFAAPLFRVIPVKVSG